MDIATTNPNAATPPAAARAADSDKPGIASDFETFLRMLTVQMENQDPLNPVKAEEFAVQLATFAGVEQTAYTNKLLEEMQAQIGLTGMSDYAGWIGKEARAPVAAHFDGTPVHVASDPDPTAEEAFLVVRDANGLEVQRTAIPTQPADIAWDGSTASGLPLPNGLYSFTVENWKDDGLSSETRADVYTRITEARIENGVPALVTAGGVEVPADSVTGLRE
ncbi:flagellar hook capping FlgD N-terminal domain-containing protein [Psychromarinibacter sp. C21-152]|uniref:Basal-body rod modification protein FlgD n=1 Tax=Psychromarinibacter sediminicola TaxID=3033385 RepID=A0AAE3T986_9RHOB|nr:flagellar hook capping FlgD N-terminal domain-containing protein [Psychromarinibacter sediminicola]MDF0601942.1 flagellar hook capping FlgD N-terminal domain-containing protein [Psychromarinibacter sediminicola]